MLQLEARLYSRQAAGDVTLQTKMPGLAMGSGNMRLMATTACVRTPMLSGVDEQVAGEGNACSPQACPWLRGGS